MTENDIMEEISKDYLEIIANRAGYFNCVQRDYGTDMTIRKARLCNERKRYLTSGKAIDIQVKAVSEKYISGLYDDSTNTIKYKFEVKNYNDLIDRANESGHFIPLILCVFILPEDKSLWIDMKPEELIIRKCAFFYRIPVESEKSKNSSKITIDIPKSNRISLEFYNEIFNSLD